MEDLARTIPLFYDRFRYLLLSYALMRERIIFDNSLFSYEKDPDYGYNVDYLYNDLSTDNENAMNQLKVRST